MSREIQDDFFAFKNFLKEYALTDILKNEDFIYVLSQQHKKYFGYLSFIAEIIKLSEEINLKPEISKDQIRYLVESCSDIGNSIFVMSHGSYKAARMLLRSSIENFIKGFNLDQIPTIIKEKNVSDIFKQIKNIKYYEEEAQKSIINIIHSNYKILCKDAHTGTVNEMQSITALNYFPNFSIKSAIICSKTTIILVSNYLYLLCKKYQSQYRKMHYKNRDNILASIPKKLRPELLGVDE